MEVVKPEPLSDPEADPGPASPHETHLKMECKAEDDIIEDHQSIKLQEDDEDVDDPPILVTKKEESTTKFEFANVSTMKVEVHDAPSLSTDDLMKILPESILKNDKVDLEAVRVEMSRNPNFKPVLRNGPYSKSSDGLHICDVCKKSFGDNFNLTIHYRIHTGERPHVCSDCGKSFTQFSNLKIHRLVHSGERPHSCQICGKSFRRAAHLQKHSLLHSGQRPHACKVCSRSFVCPTDLKNHSFTHESDKPHKCQSCDKTFATPARLRRHEQTHKSPS